MPPIPSNNHWKDYRNCYTCGNCLHLTEFHKDRNRKDGRSQRCRVCAKLYRSYLEEEKQKKHPLTVYLNSEKFKTDSAGVSTAPAPVFSVSFD